MPELDLGQDSRVDLDLELRFNGGHLPEASAQITAAPMLALWLSLAPALVRSRVDAALLLYTGRLPSALRKYRAPIRFGVIRWWASGGASPTLAEVGNAAERSLLDSSLALFLERKKYLRDLTRQVGDDVVQRLRDGTSAAAHQNDPLTTSDLIPRSVAAAIRALDGMKHSRFAMWAAATAEDPGEPHLWLIRRCLSQITEPTDLAALTLACTRGRTLTAAEASRAACSGAGDRCG